MKKREQARPLRSVLEVNDHRLVIAIQQMREDRLVYTTANGQRREAILSHARIKDRR